MEDKIFIKNLVVPCRVGVPEMERSRRQHVIVDLYVFRDLRGAGIADDLGKTVSYSEVRQKIFDFVSTGEFRLLESIAEGIASLLLESSAVTKVKVRVSKKKYAKSPNIGIEITRTQHG
ncbi:MAG: dihydroneopterin aldolase [Thaumarchaeota archaeon]|nr:dihydroneopterin aldolase [Nitrososphaerota archaeon]